MNVKIVLLTLILQLWHIWSLWFNICYLKLKANASTDLLSCYTGTHVTLILSLKKEGP